MRQFINIGNVSGGSSYLRLPAKGDGLRIDRDVTLEHFVDTIHAQDAILGKYDATGELKVAFKPKDGVDELIYCFFGEVATVDNGDGTYTHTFTAKDEDIPQFEIIKQVGGVQEKYTGAKAVKITLKTPANGDIDMSVEVITETGESVTGETAAARDGSKTFRVINGSITWGGSSIAVGAVEVTLERTADNNGFTLSSDPGRTLIPEGNFKATIKADVLADDVTMITDFLAGTAKALVLTLENGDGATVEIHVPNAIITKRGKETQVDKGLLIEDVEFAGLDDGTNGAAYVVLTNDVAAYPRT